MRFIIALFFVLLTPSIASAEEAIIVNQQGSPLRIDTYSASYTSGVGRYAREGIVHKVKLTNSGDQTILAYTVSFVSFDAFNEDMGRALGGVSIQDMAAGSSTEGSWRHNPYAAFSFEKHGTGVAYVSKVRLADGTVWKANQSFILGELRKIRSDLTSDIFENPRGGDSS